MRSRQARSTASFSSNWEQIEDVEDRDAIEVGLVKLLNHALA